jgi:hypothetical protein
MLLSLHPITSMHTCVCVCVCSSALTVTSVSCLNIKLGAETSEVMIRKMAPGSLSASLIFREYVPFQSHDSCVLRCK